MTDKVPRLRRIVWLLAVAALLTIDLAAVAAIYQSGRFYRFQEIPGWAIPVCWIATAALLVLAPRMGWRRTRDRLVPAAILVLALLPVLPLMMMWVVFGSSDSKPVVVAVSTDGRYDAVTHEVDAMIDTLCAVRLRERGGLFSRQTEVWTAPESQRCPKSVSFTGQDTISIIDARGRELTAHFDADRMEVVQLVQPTS
ncbi:hypothetical protein DFR70_119109 [Nocardia tenerifensis]|uniref:Uncharacterized protein n=1 Tax=Nocardia tenerifensis TaxID=228006 RepID=A0A318JR15_9NOCA|nr:hypothetical protein [Nocardia tenerifensis]PXX56557.1 hypothetical protein DFR70_119109 [Nocardia tenerifensis]